MVILVWMIEPASQYTTQTRTPHGRGPATCKQVEQNHRGKERRCENKETKIKRGGIRVKKIYTL
jgi:hypothetical protein